MGKAACIAQRARAAAGMASRRRARAQPRWRARRRSRALRRRLLEPRSAARRARVGSRTARAPTQGGTGAMCDEACVTPRARAAAGTASRRRARAPPRGRMRRRSRALRRRWLEPRSAASRARVGSRKARAPTNVPKALWATPHASRSRVWVEESASTGERSTVAMRDTACIGQRARAPPAWRAGGEQERRHADERGGAA